MKWLVTTKKLDNSILEQEHETPYLDKFNLTVEQWDELYHGSGEVELMYNDELVNITSLKLYR